MTKIVSLLPRIAAMIAASLLAAGCGNNPHPQPLRETREDGSPWVVRYWVLPTEPKTFDPQCQYDQMSRRVLEPVYDTLLEYHPLKTDPYEVMPGMPGPGAM